ncbi:RNA-directed DNA polymerase, eukaryota, partial [Tanacetum coccineum]
MPSDIGEELDGSSVSRYNKSMFVPGKSRPDALPTRFNISRRGIDIQDMSCPICDNAIESTDHLFFRCGLVRDIANKVLSWWNLDHANLNSYAEWKSWLVSIRMDSKLKKMFEGVWYSIWWYVWIYRNKLLFDERKPSKSMLIDNVIASSFYWCFKILEDVIISLAICFFIHSDVIIEAGVELLWWLTDQ